MEWWRGGRDDDGWKLNNNDLESWKVQNRDWIEWLESNSDAPATISMVPRFKDDIHALSVLFDPKEPPPRFIRGSSLFKVSYAFADASGQGKGYSLQHNPGEFSNQIHLSEGIWTYSKEEESSTYKQFHHCVEVVE